ncbi:MAG: universal stress protein [Acidimicrobiales bacterium]
MPLANEWSHHAGERHAIIGLDGSPQSSAALDSVVALFGERLGRITLATVVDYDAAIEPTDTGTAERARALTDLEHVSHRLIDQGINPQTVVLAGRPSDALRDFAVAQGDELLVVGSCGRGMSKAILGSAAAALAHSSTVPVLIVSTPTSGDDTITSR